MCEYPKQKLKQDWIQNGITDDAVKWTKSFGEFLQKDESRNKGTGPLTSSQIRKFFGELKRIQADPVKYKDDIPMLKAKLAYAVGRDTTSFRGQTQPPVTSFKSVGRDTTSFRGQTSNKTKIKEFYKELEIGIDSIRTDNKEDLVRFVKLVESIVAYHKFFGGK